MVKDSSTHESKTISNQRHDDKGQITRKPDAFLKIHETSESNPTRKRTSLDAPRSVTTKFVSKDCVVQRKTRSKPSGSVLSDIKASKGIYTFDGQSRNTRVSKRSTTEDVINTFKYRNKESQLTKTSDTKTRSYEHRPIEPDLEIDANDEWIISIIASEPSEQSWKAYKESSAEEEEITVAKNQISAGRGMATSNVDGAGTVPGTGEMDGTEKTDNMEPKQNVDQVERIRNKIRKISEQLNELRELQAQNSLVNKTK